MAYNEKQIQIINTAERLFALKGYDGTSVRDIAEEAGINLAMISYYFGSKEGLIKAVFEERTNDIAIKIEDLLKNTSMSPMEKIYQLIDDYVDRIATKIQFHKIMFYEQMLEKNTFITGLLNDLKKRNTERVATLIQEGREKGVFKKDIDLVLLMNTLFGTVTTSFFNKEYYKMFYNMQSQDTESFNEEFKLRIRNHIKQLFKALLQNEE